MRRLEKESSQVYRLDKMETEYACSISGIRQKRAMSMGKGMGMGMGEGGGGRRRGKTKDERRKRNNDSFMQVGAWEGAVNEDLEEGAFAV